MRLFHTAIAVQNIAKSLRFYEKTFGLKQGKTAESKSLKATFVQLVDDIGNFVELFEHESPLPLEDNLMDFQRVGIKHISFVVQEIEPVLDAVVKNGGSIIRDIHEGKTVKRNAFVGDLDGIPIELVEL